MPSLRWSCSSSSLPDLRPAQLVPFSFVWNNGREWNDGQDWNFHLKLLDVNAKFRNPYKHSSQSSWTIVQWWLVCYVISLARKPNTFWKKTLIGVFSTQIFTLSGSPQGALSWPDSATFYFYTFLFAFSSVVLRMWKQLHDVAMSHMM